MADINKASAATPSAPQSASLAGSQGRAESSFSAGGDVGSTPVSLAVAYPVNTVMELKLAPRGDIVRGIIYCTDDISNSIVIKKSLAHTTLACEITVVNAASVLEAKAVARGGNGEESGRENGLENIEELSLPLPNVSKKALEERERRAIRLAEESFSHINQRASPEGQKIFDKLLKACNEVAWRGESILVLNQVRVDPPYTPGSCVLVGSSGGLNEGSLDRVKKIVAAASERL